MLRNGDGGGRRIVLKKPRVCMSALYRGGTHGVGGRDVQDRQTSKSRRGGDDYNLYRHLGIPLTGKMSTGYLLVHGVPCLRSWYLTSIHRDYARLKKFGG